MSFEEAMEIARRPAFVKREAWRRTTLRERFDPDTEVSLGLWTEQKLGSAAPQLPYVPSEEDRAATDWRIARSDEEPGSRST